MCAWTRAHDGLITRQRISCNQCPGGECGFSVLAATLQMMATMTTTQAGESPALYVFLVMGRAALAAGGLLQLAGHTCFSQVGPPATAIGADRTGSRSAFVDSPGLVNTVYIGVSGRYTPTLACLGEAALQLYVVAPVTRPGL
jgi:hypothetical protein